MKTLLVGIGAAGGKSVMEAIYEGIVDIKDTIIINSTSKDFPADYTGKTIMLSPDNTGCGKERAVAKKYTVDAIQNGKFNDLELSEYTTIICCTSVEGGTGSGSTPIIAKFFHKVYSKNVHIIAFTGFHDDVRGLNNTIEFFQEIDKELIIQAISNASFLTQASGNKFKAEELANKDMCKRVATLTGQDFIAGSQNIDDTDILKVSNTSGYMTVEKKEFTKNLESVDDFNKLIKSMIYNSASIKSNLGAVRLGVILNINEESEDAIDYSFTDLKEAYGNPYESFLQKQWDGKKQYVAYIVSGMQLPLDALRNVYEKYKEETAKVNKAPDLFYSELQEMNKDEEDDQFDMIKPVKHGESVDDFLSSL